MTPSATEETFLTPGGLHFGGGRVRIRTLLGCARQRAAPGGGAACIPGAVAPKPSADAVLSSSGLGTGANTLRTTERIVVIGTSTGGTQALEAVLTRLPACVRASSWCSTCPGSSPGCSPSD